MKEVKVLRSDLSDIVGNEIWHVIVTLDDGTVLMGATDHNPLVEGTLQSLLPTLEVQN